jgi:hypothetical protein
MTDRSRTFASEPEAARPVSRPTDRAERDADRAADEVVRGRSVPRAALGRSELGERPTIRRQEQGSGKSSEDDKKLEALKKTGEAVLETKPVKVLKQKILEDPRVKTVTDAVTSPVGLTVGGVALAGGLAGLAAAGKELPVQIPEIPLDTITPGLSAKVTITGPLDNPTFAGLAITYKEQAPPGPRASTTASERYRAETARMAREQEAFRAGLRYAPGSKEAEERRMMDEAIRYVVSEQTRKLGIPGLSGPVGLMVPLAPRRETKRKDEPVQRAPATNTDRAVPEVAVDRALAGGGRPLDEPIRRRMEARFGHDFSAVRVHDDSRAADAARSIDAAAFTVGTDIAFAPGRFSTSSPEGVHLLAHELAHVVQAGPHDHDGRAAPVHRRGVFETLGILLGISEGEWEERELREYLEAITASGRIDGSYDADNKARAIVRLWKASTAGWELRPIQKSLLIREMLDGPTLNEDETAIIDLLELSDASDLRAVLGGANGVPYREIEPDIHGEERERLDAWVASRFRGGRDALLRGRVEVVGPARPARAPNFGFNAATLDALFDSDRSHEDLIAIIDTYSAADRRRALQHLIRVRRPRQRAALERLAQMREAATERSRRDTIDQVARRRRRQMLRTERVLMHYMAGEVPASEAELIAGTTSTDPARATEIREALRPEVARTASGARVPFEATLAGESQSYEQKLADWLAGHVDRAYDRLVVGRGRAEHRDPSRTRPLSAFEEIGNVSRRETLRVFGSVLRNPAPPLRADRPGRRGNIHDQFADAEREQRRMSRRQRRGNAQELVLYFFTSERWVRRLNRDHHAVPAFDDHNRPRNDEARAQLRVARQFVRNADHVRRLNEIDRNWPGLQLGADIWVQRFRGDTPERDRLLLWDIFQTLIHEYLHALAHRRYQDYAQTFGDRSNEYNTLIEGVDSLLTEIVWEDVIPRIASLRPEIEGPTYSALPAIDVPHASRRRYPSYTQALRLVDLVGISNVYAAYFVGLVDRIGGPSGSTP